MEKLAGVMSQTKAQEKENIPNYIEVFQKTTVVTFPANYYYQLKIVISKKSSLYYLEHFTD